jgi:hypothetical protein
MEEIRQLYTQVAVTPVKNRGAHLRGIGVDPRAQIPRSAHAVYLCVLCGSENKQRLFPYTTLTDWFL